MDHLPHIVETYWSPTNADCMRATCRECGASCEAFIALVDDRGRWIGDPADRWAAIRASENTATAALNDPPCCPPRCQASEYDKRVHQCALIGHAEVEWAADGRQLLTCSRCGCGLAQDCHSDVRQLMANRPQAG